MIIHYNQDAIPKIKDVKVNSNMNSFKDSIGPKLSGVSLKAEDQDGLFLDFPSDSLCHRFRKHLQGRVNKYCNTWDADDLSQSLTLKTLTSVFM